MKNPLLTLYRRMVLQQVRSTVPTALMPLSRIKSAVVYVDTSTGEDTQVICRTVQQYFDYHGIPVMILCPSKRDFNLYGRLKKHVRGTRDSRQEDLFISLAGSPDNFAAEYEARSSLARFKVGRCNLPDDVFDLVVADSEEGEASQTAAFAAIKDFLDKIR